MAFLNLHPQYDPVRRLLRWRASGPLPPSASTSVCSIAPHERRTHRGGRAPSGSAPSGTQRSRVCIGRAQLLPRPASRHTSVERPRERCATGPAKHRAPIYRRLPRYFGGSYSRRKLRRSSFRRMRCGDSIRGAPGAGYDRCPHRPPPSNALLWPRRLPISKNTDAQSTPAIYFRTRVCVYAFQAVQFRSGSLSVRERS